jgi:hypothetical protein
MQECATVSEPGIHEEYETLSLERKRDILPRPKQTKTE